jgi:hypothetical protein
MKFNVGDHLQEINDMDKGQTVDGYVVEFFTSNKSGTDWYRLENNELHLINHWVPEYKLELHKQPLRDKKLNELGI